MASLCCPAETPIEHEGRLSADQLKSAPIHIWWHRRRVHRSPSRLLSDDVSINRSKDKSPFPSSWSINYSGSGAGDRLNSDALIEATETDDSSVFSTMSQEHRLKRDEFGNCLKHPLIQLARRKQNIPTAKSRFSRMFYKASHSIGDESNEWEIIHATCPECEKEYTKNSKARYHYKPNKKNDDAFHQQLNNSVISPTHSYTKQDSVAVTHVPFPATLTLIKSHPHLEEGTMALKVRTDAIPTDQTMHLSCGAADGESFWEWKTPDGALDFLHPADSTGKSLQSPNNTQRKKGNSDQLVTPIKKKTNKSEYQVMERIIPISSIDHISRGGDAWDVLRQSTGDQDEGCRCDVKIHGFCDRLLRFDVVNFDNMKNNGGNGGLGLSYVTVDFSQSQLPASGTGKKWSYSGIGPSSNTHSASHSESYTPEDVISKLNSIVLWERVRRKKGVANFMTSIANWLEEYLSLGAPKVDDLSINNPPEQGRTSIDRHGRFDVELKL